MRSNVWLRSYVIPMESVFTFEEVILSRDFRGILFWILLHDPFGSMRDPVLESSPDCKRVASVNIDTNVTRLQSVLETKWGC